MQTVTIECQECEAVDTFELDGCMIIGILPDGQLVFKLHDLSWGRLFDTIVESVSFRDIIQAVHDGLGKYLEDSFRSNEKRQE